MRRAQDLYHVEQFAVHTDFVFIADADIVEIKLAPPPIPYCYPLSSPYAGPTDIYGCSETKVGTDFLYLLSTHLKRRGQQTTSESALQFCQLTQTTARIIVTSDGNTAPTARSKNPTLWENVSCAWHHHGCTTDGRCTDNKEIEETRQKQAFHRAADQREHSFGIARPTGL
jgi:hypothetical protein